MCVFALVFYAFVCVAMDDNFFLACAGSVESPFALRGEGAGLPKTAALASSSLPRCLLCVVWQPPPFLLRLLCFSFVRSFHSDKAGDLVALQSFSAHMDSLALPRSFCGFFLQVAMGRSTVPSFPST